MTKYGTPLLRALRQGLGFQGLLHVSLPTIRLAVYGEAAESFMFSMNDPDAIRIIGHDGVCSDVQHTARAGLSTNVSKLEKLGFGAARDFRRYQSFPRRPRSSC